MADRHDLLAAMADKPLQGFADVIGIDDADDTGKEATDGTGKEATDGTGKEATDGTGKEATDGTGIDPGRIGEIPTVVPPPEEEVL